jgi:Carboxypeptidase regulatory-like domain
MFRLPFGVARACSISFLFFFFSSALVVAQLETATISGQIVDSSGLRVAGAQVDLVDVDRGTSTSAAADNSGLYRFPSVHPGRYRMQVRASGFRVIDVTGLTVNVQDHLEQNFKLVVGSVSESITVQGSAPLVDTETGTVSTVVDRNFAENLPMNGRSFQSLIELTPGVALTTTNTSDSGQFSVNGQRAASNYWMVDGVGANIGIGIAPANGLAGAVGSFSALGGTNSLVSVDAMQEFRIETSTYAPEFGRTPGGQISILTRSGTNQFHGTAFDYLRNDALDASNWFNGFCDPKPTCVLPKSKERQNDFGGTLGGPIVKNRTFFFFSYEGLRLRLPQTTLSYVPDLPARQNAVSAMQPYLNSFPLPSGGEADVAPGVAPFRATYSNPASLDAVSLRIDHKLTDKWYLFGRYSYSPSEIVARGGTADSLNTVTTTKITTQTGTLGATTLISSSINNEFRFNYSRTSASGFSILDNFGGASPLPSLPLPAPFNSSNADFFLDVFSLTPGGLLSGPSPHNLQRQINIVDTLSVQRGLHSLKFGVDWRRLSPKLNPVAYTQDAFFLDVPSAQNGDLLESFTVSSINPIFLFRNLGAYAEDTWRILPRLTITYGARWDVDFAPATLSGPNFPGVTGFNLTDLSNLSLAPAGTVPYNTRYGNIAPRIGGAYQISKNQEWQTVLRGGFGVFYDLASSEAGNIAFAGTYPFFGFGLNVGGTFPLSPAVAAPPPIVPPNASNFEPLAAFDPHLRLPYTLQWNVALEQALRSNQSISVSYVGSAGRRLLQTAIQTSPSPNLFEAELVGNFGSSDYDALQAQFQRKLSHGLQALASYAWAHSIDTASAGSPTLASNAFVPAAVSQSRGPSDFDIRNAFSAAVTYDFPTVRGNAVAREALGGWSIENFIVARSAPPVNVEATSVPTQIGNSFGAVRPDLVSGQILYLHGSQFPGGVAFNPAAFANPPVDPNTGFALRQGNLPRNFLRGFGSTEWDFAVHRSFPIHELLQLQFRAEIFNLLNHPNFGSPSPAFGVPGFGISSQMLSQSLSLPGSAGSGGFNPLYQIGGPRSIQLALKLQF